MKRKTIIFGVVATTLSLVCVGTAYELTSAGSFKNKMALGDTHVCSGNHYLENVATSSQTGNSEYWVCCQCHEAFDSKPQGGGTWTDVTTGVAQSGGINSDKVYYYITLDKQAGIGGDSAVNKARYNHELPSVVVPTAEDAGKTFAGYFTDVDNGVKYYDANGNGVINYPVQSNTTLYAHYDFEQYSITYKDQGGLAFSGEHESGYPVSHTYNTATTLKSATKAGYTFGGWFTTTDCSGTAVTELGATAYLADITLYAKWTANTYNITFDVDGGTAKDAIQYTVSTSSQEIELGTPTTTQVCTQFDYYEVKTQPTGGEATLNGTKLTIPANCYEAIEVKVVWKTVHENVQHNFCVKCNTLTATISSVKATHGWKENFAEIGMNGDKDFEIVFWFNYTEGDKGSAVDGMWMTIGGINITTDFYVKMRPDWWADAVSGNVYADKECTNLVTGDNSKLPRGTTNLKWNFDNGDFHKAKQAGWGTLIFRYTASTGYLDCFQDFNTNVEGYTGWYRVYYNFYVKFGGTNHNIFVKASVHWVSCNLTKIDVNKGENIGYFGSECA